MNAVLYEISDHVVTITLNRPESRNALNTAMCEELLAAARAASQDTAVRLVVLRSEGPVFCAGADLEERKSMNDDQVRARRLKAFTAYDALESLPMPSVAVVHGLAIGSGCEIAAACDFIVATPAAGFRTPEALWGTLGATQRLPRILGKRLAKDLMFTGRTLTAEEARAAGLVSRIVEPDELAAALEELATTIVSAPARALAAAKRCIDRAIEIDARGALAIELLAIEEILSDADWRNHLAGFGSKDKP